MLTNLEVYRLPRMLEIPWFFSEIQDHHVNGSRRKLERYHGPGDEPYYCSEISGQLLRQAILPAISVPCHDGKCRVEEDRS